MDEGASSDTSSILSVDKGSGDRTFEGSILKNDAAAQTNAASAPTCPQGEFHAKVSTIHRVRINVGFESDKHRFTN